MNATTAALQKQIELLDKSIEHWEDIAQGGGISTGTSSCPLCQQYYDHLDKPLCTGCPIQEYTGISGCAQTPYADYFDVCKSCYRDEKENNHKLQPSHRIEDLVSITNQEKERQAAQEELDFLQSLRDEGYDAVCLAIGAAMGSSIKVKGADSEGVVDSLDFLRTYNIRGSVPVGKNVVVIGGGNAAIDAARTALRLDAETAVEGTPAVGAVAEVQGLLLPDGAVLARRIVVQST